MAAPAVPAGNFEGALKRRTIPGNRGDVRSISQASNMRSGETRRLRSLGSTRRHSRQPGWIGREIGRVVLSRGQNIKNGR
jgi:hypothetical protein